MKKIFLFAAVTLALTACDKNDDNAAPASGMARITATIGESHLSRASNTEWAPGDSIGISVTIGNDVMKYVNMKYITTKGDGNFTGTTPLYFYKNLSATAYYPFTGTEDSTPAIIEAETSAEFQTKEKQPEIDFLYAGKTPLDVSGDTPELIFKFAHQMSKMTLVFTNGNDGMDVSKIISYKIEGLVLNGTFNPADGTAKADERVSAAPLSLEVNDVKDGVAVAPLLFFPQKPGNDKVKLTIYTDELNDPQYLHDYSCILSFENGELKPGSHYQYTIIVTKKGLSLKHSILNWTDVTNSFHGESE